MKIYLSSLPVALIQRLHNLNPSLLPNVLITFYDLKESKQTEYAQTYRDLFAGFICDCGAFSLNVKLQNGQLTESEYEAEAAQLYLDYIEHMQEHKSEYDFYMSMDDRFDSAGFLHNRERYNEMVGVGIDPVPIIHTLDPDSEEVRYWLNPKNKPKMLAIGQCDQYAKRQPEVLSEVSEKLYAAGIKPYFLGITNPLSLATIPVHSCDSKSWLDAGTRGRVLYWNPKSVLEDKTEVLYFPQYEGEFNASKGFLYDSYKYLSDFELFIYEKLGFTVNDLLGLRKVRNRLLVNVVYFIELEKKINSMHEELYISFDE